MNIIKVIWYIIFSLFSDEEVQVEEEPFPIIMQKSQMERGTRFLQMISSYHGVKYNINTLNKLCSLSEQGTSMGNIGDAGELIGLYNLAVSVDYKTLLKEVP